MQSHETLRKAVQDLAGRAVGDKRGSPRHLAIEKKGALGRAEILGFPEIPAQPIQDLNTASPTYGAFLFMLDYDPLP